MDNPAALDKPSIDPIAAAARGVLERRRRRRENHTLYSRRTGPFTTGPACLLGPVSCVLLVGG